MRPITRRQSLSIALAALAPEASTADPYPTTLVQRHDESTARLLRAQITDPASPHCGAVPDPATGLHHAVTAAGLLETCAAAILCPQSRYHHDNELTGRIRLAVAFLDRVQLPSGNISLLTTNFNSPPDTGFATIPVASAVRLANLHHDAELAALPASWLRRAGPALAAGGVHTPNHRWVICHALAALDEVLPDPRYRRRIDQWLAEGIDIDSDGQYTERSTAIYNIVVDRALTNIAIKQQRWELLEPVRRNLDAMQYLLHSNGEVVTEISRRQDRNERGEISGYWMPLRYLAVHDNNGRYAAMAQLAEPHGASLAAAMQYPELLAPLPVEAPIPEDFEKTYDAWEIVRWRRGPMSATLSRGPSARILSVHKGEAVIQAVRFAAAFFGKGQFLAQKSANIPGGYRLTQSLEAGYYQPFEPPRKITSANYNSSRHERRQSEICKLTQSVEIREDKGRFALTFDSRGTDGVPVAIELSLRPGGTLEGCTSESLITGNRATYRNGSDQLHFGSGLTPPHTWTHLRGAEPPIPGPAAYVTGFTPFHHTVEIE